MNKREQELLNDIRMRLTWLTTRVAELTDGQRTLGETFEPGISAEQELERIDIELMNLEESFGCLRD